MTKITMRVRATPPSARFPFGIPSEPMTADYTDGEIRWREAMLARLDAAEPDEQQSIARELVTYHEAKCLLDATPREETPRPKQEPAFAPIIGKYHGASPTDTERASGIEIEMRDQGPLKPGGACHVVLVVYADGQRRTAYDASYEESGDFHARRRESRRLLERGFLVKDGELPNRAANGREHVDAYRITAEGIAELGRLGNPW